MPLTGTPPYGLITIQIFVFVAIGALVLAARGRQRTRRARAWGEFASSVGLSFDPGGFVAPPRVSGTYRGRESTLVSVTHGGGRSRSTWTRIVLAVAPPAGARLVLCEEDLFGRIGRFLGARDVEVGDPAIDKRFTIKCEPPDLAVQVVSAGNLRASLLAARRLDITVAGSTLTFERQGLLLDPDELRALFDLLCEVADAVERTR